jgi:long-chain fatty acid transport protein
MIIARIALPRPQHVFTAIVLCAAALGSGGARAGGIILYEVGTADVGLASAGYNARAQDASTVLTNPAGLTRLDGTQLLLGAQLLYGDLKFSIGPGTSPQLGTNDGGNPVGWFPGGGAFVSYSLSPELKLGFAMTGNFGLAEKYDNNWVGRYYVQETTLIGVSFLPSIAYRVNDKLSLGASLNIMYGKLEDQVAINNRHVLNPTAADGQLKLDDNTWGWGVNLGLLYELDARTRFGLTWNSQVDLDFKATPQFSNVTSPLVNVVVNRLQNATIDLGLKVPQGVMGSVYHQLNDRWALLGSVGWQQWSKFGKAEVSINTANPASVTTDLNYKDTWHFAVGAQHRLSDPWTLNFGIAYDSGFQDSGNVSPMLPVNSAWRFGVGGQNQVSKTFSWGIAGEYAYGGTLDVNRQGTLPFVLGGRGDLVGSYKNSGIFFIAANFNWKF